MLTLRLIRLGKFDWRGLKPKWRFLWQWKLILACRSDHAGLFSQQILLLLLLIHASPHLSWLSALTSTNAILNHCGCYSPPLSLYGRNSLRFHASRWVLRVSLVMLPPLPNPPCYVKWMFWLLSYLWHFFLLLFSKPMDTFFIWCLNRILRIKIHTVLEETPLGSPRHSAENKDTQDWDICLNLLLKPSEPFVSTHYYNFL